MYRLYEKSRLWFAILWIVVYVVGASITDNLLLGVPKLATWLFLSLLTAFAIVFLYRHRLSELYGLCIIKAPAVKFLYFAPLAVLCTVNLWFGLKLQYSFAETVCFVGSMVCVGFLEELIFRGFLFRAMEQDSPRAAVIISSLTFGIGHLVNLVNGSGADLLSTLLQVCEATAFGYLFVVIFCKGKSLVPCIAAHIAINASSVFAAGGARTPLWDSIVAVILCVAAAGYAIWLQKNIQEA